MAPERPASVRALKSMNCGRDATLEVGSSQASRTSTKSSRLSLSSKAVKQSPVLESSKPMVLIVGPDQKKYSIGTLRVAKGFRTMSQYVKDLCNGGRRLQELDDVRHIRKDLQNVFQMNNKTPNDVDFKAGSIILQQLESYGELQHTTVRKTKIDKVILRMIKSSHISWKDHCPLKMRLHKLLVLYKTIGAYASATDSEQFSSDPSKQTPPGTLQESAQIVIRLPHTLPATFSLLLEWFATSKLVSSWKGAEGSEINADLTVVELAQLYQLAIELEIPTLISLVADTLLMHPIYKSMMKDLIEYIISHTTPNSDLRKLLVRVIAGNATSEAFKQAVNEDWMSKEILSELTLALVQERGGRPRKWKGGHLISEEAVEARQKIHIHEEKKEAMCGPAPALKKRSAPMGADGPTRKKRKT